MELFYIIAGLLVFIIFILNNIDKRLQQIANYYTFESNPNEKLNNITTELENIKEDLSDIKMQSYNISYNTDKVRYSVGHRTESELFEEKWDIQGAGGNYEEFNKR